MRGRTTVYGPTVPITAHANAVQYAYVTELAAELHMPISHVLRGLIDAAIRDCEEGRDA